MLLNVKEGTWKKGERRGRREGKGEERGGSGEEGGGLHTCFPSVPNTASATILSPHTFRTLNLLTRSSKMSSAIQQVQGHLLVSQNNKIIYMTYGQSQSPSV